MLRQELRQARERLDGLVGELRSVDQELEGLEAERSQFRLVREACRALDELDDMGASELFWGGGRAADGDGGDHIRLVRGRIDAFEKRLDQIEERHQSILDEIQVQEDSTDVIAGYVLEAEHFEEQRKLEWQIERDVDQIPIRISTMPWAHGGEDDQRFRKALAISLLLSLLLGIIFQLVELPIPERWKILEEQNRLTRLIREELQPPVAIEEAKPTPAEEPLPTETIEEPLIAEESTPQADPVPEPKSQAKSKGILAFRDKISGLSTHKAVARLGANARINDSGGGKTGLPKRAMVTSQVPGSSGGINVASLSRDTGGSGNSMGGVEITQATSTIGSGGGSDRPLSGGGAGLGRTDEEIQIVFDRHKAALYRMYNRELRKNPTLKGQMVLRMTIEADGSVSLCELKSTNMKSRALAAQVVEHVKTFDFGAKDGISAITIAYPIDFLPAT